jgi:Cu(I)/Ag(I) efflux system protein CusF
MTNSKGKKMKLTKLALAVFALSLSAPLTASGQDAMVKGEVKKVDAAGGKITMTSGPIKNLDMEDDNMTMVFRVQNPAMLKQVKPGDKVQFEAEKASAGFTITKLEKAK